MKYFKIWSLYLFFCLIATVSNLLTQRVILAAIGDVLSSFIAAVFLGTLVGLLTKYYLDKSFIFRQNGNPQDRNRQFIKYATTGIATTSIFWGFETLFWLFGKTQFLREIGAIIGLLIGYTVKYNLDKRYVFST